MKCKPTSFGFYIIPLVSDLCKRGGQWTHKNGLLLEHSFRMAIRINEFVIVQALVVQKLECAIQRINHYPVDEHYQNQWSYPVDRSLVFFFGFFSQLSLGL